MRSRATIALLALILSIAPVHAQDRKVQALKDASSITYYLTHPLHKIEATSKDLDCTAELDPAKKSISSVTARVDVTTFDSGNSNRDSHAMEVIDALSYPEASFTSTHVVQQGDSLAVSGNLTFHGVTHEIVIMAAPEWSPGKLTVQGGFTVLLSDYKVERPSLLMIPVENTLRFSLTASFAL